MNNFFIKLSDIRSNAYNKAYSFNSSNKSTKAIKQIIGVNPLKREWVNKASNKLALASQNQGTKKIKYLIASLDILYFCEWVLKENQYTDSEIFQLIEKAETSYINNCLAYIENFIHNSKKAFNNYTGLSEAVNVLIEYNPTMGQKYKQMLVRYQSLYVTYEKINEICDLPNDLFSKSDSVKLAKLYSVHNVNFKMYPELQEQIIDLLNYKVENLYIDSINKLNKVSNSKVNNTLNSLIDFDIFNSKQLISILSITSIYSNFFDIYKPLEHILNTHKYDKFLDEFEQIKNIENIITVKYKEWLVVYKYYSLPRNKIDEIKIMNVIKEINQHLNVFNAEIKELKELDPTPITILSFLESLIDDGEKESLISFYKVENELINAKETPEKIDEIIRFINHINNKIFELNHSKNKSNLKLKSELSKMVENFLLILDYSIEKQLYNILIENPNIRIIKDSFDYYLSRLHLLNDVTRISNLQELKKQVIKIKNDIPELMSSLINDIDYYKKLPVTIAKTNLLNRIIKQYNEINELMPIMIMLKYGDVENYLCKIQEIENDLKLFENDNSKDETLLNNYSRMIILDRYSLRNIVVFLNDTIKIGRNDEQNDLLLKSEWVSGSHCEVDFKEQILKDLQSTNGTYVNQEHIQIEKFELKNILSFNIAEAFDFLIKKQNGFYIFKVSKVFDSELLKNNLDYVQSLFNTDFIWMEENNEFYIDAFNGSIKEVNDGSKKNIADIVVKKISNNSISTYQIIDTANSKIYEKISANNEIISDRFSVYLS